MVLFTSARHKVWHFAKKLRKKQILLIILMVKDLRLLFEQRREDTHLAKYAKRWNKFLFLHISWFESGKMSKAVCGDIRHHEKAKCWKGQAAKRGQFGAKKANIYWFKKLKRAGKGQAWCKKANIYWLKEWSHIGRHLLQRLFRNGWSRNNLNLLKKEKNKNTTSLLKYNTTHLSRTFPLFQGAH